MRAGCEVLLLLRHPAAIATGGCCRTILAPIVGRCFWIAASFLGLRLLHRALSVSRDTAIAAAAASTGAALTAAAAAEAVAAAQQLGTRRLFEGAAERFESSLEVAPGQRSTHTTHAASSRCARSDGPSGLCPQRSRRSLHATRRLAVSSGAPGAGAAAAIAGSMGAIAGGHRKCSARESAGHLCPLALL